MPDGAREAIRRADMVSKARGSSAWLAALGQRALSALVLIPIVIALVFFGGWVAFGGALLALVLASYELYTMFSHRGWRPVSLLSLGMGVVFLVAARLLVLGHPYSQVFMLLGVGVSGLIVLTFAWVILTRHDHQAGLTDLTLTIAGAIYLGWPLAAFLLLRGDTVGAGTAGFWWLLALFFMVWSDDTFALLSGHYFGRHKLAPHLSPAKTWEGFFGGLVFTVIAALVFLLAIPSAFSHSLQVPWYHAILLGVLVGIVAPIGDLAESLLKRATGVQNSGTLIPGHGGILDRMDSLLFAVLVVLFYAAFLGAVTL